MYNVIKDILILEASQLSEKNGVLFAEGIFQKGDEPNANRRIYPMEYLKREVDKLIPISKDRGLVGELDHPWYNEDINESSIIHMKNGSHIIPKLWYEGKTVYGQLEFLDTPSGLIAQEFLRKRVRFGVSSRSLGDVVMGADGFYYVADNLRISTWDVVIGPSVYESRVKQIASLKEWKVLRETKNRLDTKMNADKSIKDDTERIRKEIKNIMENELGFTKND